MTIKENGVEIELVFDEDGYPLISINPSGYYARNGRPTIEIKLKEIMIHNMFDDEDNRWNN